MKVVELRAENFKRIKYEKINNITIATRSVSSRDLAKLRDAIDTIIERRKNEYPE